MRERERERELEAGGLGILRTGRRDIHPLVRPSRGASVWGWKGARETAEGSDRYNRDAHTCSRNERCCLNCELHPGPSAEGVELHVKVLAFLLVINIRFTRALITECNGTRFGYPYYHPSLWVTRRDGLFLIAFRSPATKPPRTRAGETCFPGASRVIELILLWWNFSSHEFYML